MKFLVDNAISPIVSVELQKVGYDSVHVGDYGMGEADDSSILLRAEQEDRIIISGDTDFGTLLALREKAKPSFILFRSGAPHRPTEQVMLLVNNLPNLEDALESGAIVAFNRDRIRIRELPIGK